MTATSQHGMIHLHMTVEEAEALKDLTGSMYLGSKDEGYIVTTTVSTHEKAIAWREMCTTVYNPLYNLVI